MVGISQIRGRTDGTGRHVRRMAIARDLGRVAPPAVVVSPCRIPSLVSFGLSHVRWHGSPLDPRQDIGRPFHPFVLPSTDEMGSYQQGPFSFHRVENRTWTFGSIPWFLNVERKIHPIHVWRDVHVARDRAFARLPRTPSSTSSRTSATWRWNETGDRIRPAT